MLRGSVLVATGLVLVLFSGCKGEEEEAPTGTFFDEILKTTYLTEDGPWGGTDFGIAADATAVTNSRFWMNGTDLMEDTIWYVYDPGSSDLSVGDELCTYKSRVTFEPIEGIDSAVRLHVVEHVYEDNCGWGLANTQLDLLHEVLARDADDEIDQYAMWYASEDLTEQTPRCRTKLNGSAFCYRSCPVDEMLPGLSYCQPRCVAPGNCPY